MIGSKLTTISKIHNCDVKSELLQNKMKPVSLENAQEIDPVVALRWRWRICRVSGKVFDITKEGLFYTCGEYA
jgi:hypothetical protein